MVVETGGRGHRDVGIDVSSRLSYLSTLSLLPPPLNFPLRSERFEQHDRSRSGQRVGQEEPTPQQEKLRRRHVRLASCRSRAVRKGDERRALGTADGVLREQFARIKERHADFTTRRACSLPRRGTFARPCWLQRGWSRARCSGCCCPAARCYIRCRLHVLPCPCRCRRGGGCRWLSCSCSCSS